MKVERQNVGTVEVLTPIGALTEEDGEQFTQQLLDMVMTTNPRLVVCLKDVSFMDSVALEGLVEAADELSDRAAKLKLVKVTPSCREILEITGLSRRFQFFEETQDAVKSFL